jgi:CRISPR-associated protein Cas1
MLIPYEHKRGRAARASDGKPEAWRSDRLQIVAYALLLEEHAGREVAEGRVRYHADNVTVRVAVDETARAELTEAIARARLLQSSVERPPVATNERLCAKCSLAPVCLPEEARLASRLRIADCGLRIDEAADSKVLAEHSKDQRPKAKGQSAVVRLFPAVEDRRTLHVLSQGARVGKSGDRFSVNAPDEETKLYPVKEVANIVLHGFAQISTQALRFCAEREVAVHWLTGGGRYVGAWQAGTASVQRRIRQYKALTDADFCLRLARRLAETRARGQLSFLLRASREAGNADADATAGSISQIRKLLGPLSRAESRDSLRGYEGGIGAQYFAALPHLVTAEAGAKMRPDGRSRRPPRDRANALLSYGYALLLKDITNAILVVGLDPALGFYHQPRTQAPPLALDLMELFRVPLVDLPVIASINRRQWDTGADFTIAGKQVWLSDTGRKKLIEIYERRKQDMWKHPVIGHSLSYARLIELETRLLEKEWSGEGGLFARLRLR